MKYLQKKFSVGMNISEEDHSRIFGRRIELNEEEIRLILQALTWASSSYGTMANFKPHYELRKKIEEALDGKNQNS